MANRDPEALKAAQLAYERSNASLSDYDPAKQEAVDLQFAALLGGENTHPVEPITPNADNVVVGEVKAAEAAKTDSK